MNAPDKFLLLPDTQALPDLRRLPIQKVGIRDLRYPLRVRAAGGQVQSVLATLQMTVGLPHDVKGTHMSRFVEVLERQREPLDLDGFRALFAAMLERLDATTGHLSMRFTYFIRKEAPVSGVASLLDYDATWEAACETPGDTRITVSVTAPVTSLCPCSKKIADYGAHNQRSLITIRATLHGASIALEELVARRRGRGLLRAVGPAQAPGREVGDRARLRQPEVRRGPGARHRAAPRPTTAAWARSASTSENFESIHNHSAYAEIEGFGAART